MDYGCLHEESVGIWIHRPRLRYHLLRAFPIDDAEDRARDLLGTLLLGKRIRPVRDDHDFVAFRSSNGNCSNGSGAHPGFRRKIQSVKTPAKL
jgi:hypothetical protein